MKASGLRGIIIVLFTPAWPALSATLLTSGEGRQDRCLVLPCLQRLAVMAVDFSRWNKRSFADVHATCAAQGEHQPRPWLFAFAGCRGSQALGCGPRCETKRPEVNAFGPAACEAGH
jgi:hypothetical protein